MKVTHKTDGAVAVLRGMEARVVYQPYSGDSVAKVVEFPKVWREDGKQYKVTDCEYYHNGNWDDKVVIRVPQGVFAVAWSCGYTIEKY